MKRMDDEELKRLLKEGMEYEADLIMKEVESDPNMKDVVAPESIHENLWKQIREHQAVEEQENDDQKKEEEELIRLGKKYKKKLGRRKYYILIAAIICIFGVGTVSIGDGKKMFQEMTRKLGDREQTVVNSGDGENIKPRDILDEEEAYEEINEKLGFWAVRMVYLPEGIEFTEARIEENLMNARVCYSHNNDKLISYCVVANYREGSINTDVEDECIQKYKKEINEVDIQFKQYQVEQGETCRWSINFTYNNAQYLIIMTGINQDEVEKIAENLYFS